MALCDQNSALAPDFQSTVALPCPLPGHTHPPSKELFSYRGVRGTADVAGATQLADEVADARLLLQQLILRGSNLGAQLQGGWSSRAGQDEISGQGTWPVCSRPWKAVPHDKEGTARLLPDFRTRLPCAAPDTSPRQCATPPTQSSRMKSGQIS